MPLIGHVAATAGKVGSFRRNNVLTVLFVWNLVVFGAFVLTYRFYGLRHVEMPKEGMKPSWGLAFYFAAITHFSFTPPGEMMAKDTAGRALIATHSFLSWAPLFWVVFSPTSGASNANGNGVLDNFPPVPLTGGAYW